MDPVNDSRVRRVRVSTELLAAWLRGEAQPVRITTAPPDLQIVGISQATIGPGEWHLIAHSATFEPVTDRYDIPFIDIEYTT